MRTLSTPLQQPAAPGIRISTHPRSHHNTEGLQLCCHRARSVVTLEVSCGQHTLRTTTSSSCEVQTCGGKSGLSNTYGVGEIIKHCFSRTGGRRHTSSTASIKVWASLFGRRETVSIAFVLEEIASIDEMSSSWEMPPLTNICKARSPRSGGSTDAERLHPSD